MDASPSPEPPVLDEQVWGAWLAKTRKEEREGFEKRLRIMVFISPLLVGALLYWIFRTV